MAIIEKAPAKINLGLDIIGKTTRWLSWFIYDYG